MALRADDLQSAGSLGILIKLDIGAAAGHVSGYGDSAMLSRIGDDLGFKLMELRIQDVVAYAFLLEFRRELLGGFDGDRADQDGLPLRMGRLDFLDYGVELLLLGLINLIFIVNAANWRIGRDRDDVHAVDVAELLFLRHGRTGHTGFLPIFIKEVLEGDGRKRLALTLDFDILLRLYCLMQTIRITASGHDTSREIINDEDLIVLDNVILVAEHDIIRPQCQIHVVLEVKVLCVRKVLDLEELLDLRNALLCERDYLVLLVDDEIS